MKSIAVFADVQNIYYTCRQNYQKQFNYRQLWKDISQQGEIKHAIAYATNKDDHGQAKFQAALAHIGFEVKLKPYIQRSDGTAKGDWDVGITIDIMTLAPTVDLVVLLSGDGDFAILLENIKQTNDVETAVYGVRELTAKALIDATDKFHKIDIGLLL